MDCKQVENIIFKTVPVKADELPADVRNHLKECDSCRLYFEVTEKTAAFVKERSQAGAGDDFFEDVMKKIRRENSHSIIPERSIIPRKYRAVAASVLLVTALGMGILAGRFSASVYSDSIASNSDEAANYMGIELADNSFDLINIDE